MDAQTTSLPYDINITPDIKLYPNPNSGFFTMFISDDLGYDQCNVFITSMDGRLVHNERILREELIKEFKLSHLSAGSYILTIVGEQTIFRTCFIKD
jgi:hypothetical protein